MSRLGHKTSSEGAAVIDCFTSMCGTQPDVFQQMLQNVCTRAHGLDPNWVRNPSIQRVPDTLAEGETKKFNLVPWLLGFSESDAIKGIFKMPHIFKCIIALLEQPNASTKDPLDVLMMVGAKIGSELPAFSVRHNLGFAKSLVTRVILFATVDMRWDGASIKMFLKELQALLSIECVYSLAPNPKEQMAKALGDKNDGC